MGKLATKPYSIKNVYNFIDRDEQRALFWNTYHEVKTGEFDIISYYGVGGSGKSSLLNKLSKELEEKIENGRSDYVYLSLEHSPTKEKIIFSLMLALKEKCKKIQFPLVNAAKAKIEESCKNPVVIDSSKKGFFEMGDISDYAGIGAGIASLYPPGGPFLAPLIIFGGNITRKVVDRKRPLRIRSGKNSDILKSIAERDSKYSIEMLHSFFLEDVWSYFEKRKKPFVIFLDAYDEYVNRGKDGVMSCFQDEWMYSSEAGLINLPNTIWVISCRNKLDWWSKDAISEENIRSLSDFTKEYTDIYLKQAGIMEDDLLSALYSLTHGTPVYLELCTKTYYLIKEKYNRIPSIEDFGHDIKGLVNRFVGNLSSDVQKLIFLLSCFPNVWEKEMVFHIANSLGYKDIEDTLDDVLALSMFEEQPDGFRLHATVRDILRSCYSAAQNADKAIIKYEKEKLFNASDFLEQKKWLMKLSEHFIRCDKDSLSNEEILKILNIFKVTLNVDSDFGNYERCIVPYIEFIVKQKAKPEIIIKARNYRCKNLFLAGYYKDLLPYAQDTYDYACQKLYETDEDAIDSLEVLSGVCFELKKYEAALNHYTKYINLRDTQEAITDVRYNLSNIYIKLNRLDDAEKLLNPYFEVLKSNFGMNNYKTLSCLNSLGIINLEIGGKKKVEAALTMFKECYQNAKNNEDDRQMKNIELIAHLNIADAYVSLEELEKSLEILEECYEERKTFYGKKSYSTANCLLDMGRIYLLQAKYATSKEKLLKYMSIMHKECNENSPSVLKGLTYLASACSNLDEYDEAKELWYKAFIISESYPEICKFEEQFSIMWNYSSVCMRIPDYKEALKGFEKCYDVATSGNLNQEKLKTLKAIIDIKIFNEKYEDALKLYFDYQKLLQEINGLYHQDVIKALIEISVLYKKLNNFEKEAEILFEVHQRIMKLYGEDSLEAMQVLVNLAANYEKTNNQEQLLEVYNQLNDIYIKNYGKDSDVVIGLYTDGVLPLLNNLANKYEEEKNYKKAIEINHQIIYIIKRLYGEDCDELINYMRNEWILYGDLGDIDNKIDSKRKYYEKIKSMFGIENEEVLNMALGLVYDYKLSAKYEEAHDIVQELYCYSTNKWGEKSDSAKKLMEEKRLIEKEIRKRDDKTL